MRCSGCDRELSASRWPGLICDSYLASARRHWAMRKRTNAQSTPRLAVTEPAHSLAPRQCARCGTIFLVSPDSTDLCEECECRWQRRRPTRAVLRVEGGAALTSAAGPFTPADLAEIRARLSAEPEPPKAA